MSDAQVDNPFKGFTDLIQIKAENEEEVRRRIEAFIANKRDEVNEQNIREFINPFSAEPGGGCARTEAVYLHREGQKSHISLKHVDNVEGPQTRLALDDESTHNATPRLPVDRERAEAVEERLTNMEAHLNLEKGGPGIFERLKSLEKRIMFLEGVSPEYFTQGVPSTEQKSSKKPESKTLDMGMTAYPAENLSQVENKIAELKRALKQRMEQQGRV